MRLSGASFVLVALIAFFVGAALRAAQDAARVPVVAKAALCTHGQHATLIGLGKAVDGSYVAAYGCERSK